MPHWTTNLSYWISSWPVTYLPTYLLTYLLTPLSRILLEKLSGSQLVKNLPAFYGTRRFITAFTRARHLSLSWARSIQSMYPTLLPEDNLNITLPSMPESSEWSLSLRFPHQNPVYTSHLPICATRSFHLIRLDLTTRIKFGEEYRSLNSSLCGFLESPVTLSLSGPNILLSAPFSDTLSHYDLLPGDMCMWDIYAQTDSYFKHLRMQKTVHCSTTWSTHLTADSQRSFQTKLTKSAARKFQPNVKIRVDGKSHTEKIGSPLSVFTILWLRLLLFFI